MPNLPQSFNPRAHAGRDDPKRFANSLYCVSIHAPTRGATYDSRWKKTRRRFQSTRPRGARHQHSANKQMDFQFQSTRPRGARLPSIQRLCISRTVSIHAPTRGATAYNRTQKYQAQNHTFSRTYTRRFKFFLKIKSKTLQMLVLLMCESSCIFMIT